jgi:hypothetical protein
MPHGTTPHFTAVTGKTGMLLLFFLPLEFRRYIPGCASNPIKYCRDVLCSFFLFGKGFPAGPVAVPVVKIRQAGIVATDAVYNFLSLFPAPFNEQVGFPLFFGAFYFAPFPPGFFGHGVYSIIGMRFFSRYRESCLTSRLFYLRTPELYN